MVKLHDKQFEKFIGNDAINHAINGIAVKLNDELKDVSGITLQLKYPRAQKTQRLF